MKKLLLSLPLMILIILILADGSLEAKRSPRSEKKDTKIQYYKKILYHDNPSCVTYDSLGESYYIADFGSAGFYSIVKPTEIDRKLLIPHYFTTTSCFISLKSPIVKVQ